MYIFRQASVSDNVEILKLISQTPQQGLVTLNFERNPDFFHGSNITARTSNIMLAEDSDNGEISALFSLGKREVFVNGEKQDVLYANDLRISETQRGGRLLLKVFKESRKMVGPDEFAQTVILNENMASLSTVASGRAGLPTYYPYGELTTYIVSTAYDFAPRSKIEIQTADESDVEAMQAFFNHEAAQKQFYPAYDFSKVKDDQYYRDIHLNNYYLAKDGGKIIGITGTWKQKNFKQTKIIDYPGWMALARPFYNLWCRFFGGFPLPQKGQVANYNSLHTIVAKDNNPLILSALLKHIRKQLAKQGEHTMILGICDNDPINIGLKGFVARKMKSQHFLACFGKDSRTNLEQSMPMYLEVSRL